VTMALAAPLQPVPSTLSHRERWLEIKFRADTEHHTVICIRQACINVLNIRRHMHPRRDACVIEKLDAALILNAKRFNQCGVRYAVVKVTDPPGIFQPERIITADAGAEIPFKGLGSPSERPERKNIPHPFGRCVGERVDHLVVSQLNTWKY
jgi:hypothetical protein